MVNFSTPKNWISLPLLSAGIVLVLFVFTSHAALLRDIRVGEYDSYTRIVFELDAPAEPEQIEIQPTGRLAVVFGDTSADLIRKVPVDRSPHVKEVQIWEKGSRLTVLLAIDFKDIVHESFSLTDPPRLVLDIRPKLNAPHAGGASSSGVPPTGENTPQMAASTSASESPSKPGGDAAEKSLPQAPEPPPGYTDRAPESANEVLSPTTVPSSGKRPGGLQFYLIIALVVITIVILALLLLMLLARHRWIEGIFPSTAREKSESLDVAAGTRRENESPEG